MYLTEPDPTHTCTVSIVPNSALAEDATDEMETTEGERALAAPELLEKADQPSELDDKIIGRYRLKRCLGRGVTGSVWLAQDVDSADRDVALKIMHADDRDEYVMARYTCEVRALARLDDPHIARIWENGQTPDGKLYIAMELVKGVQLGKYCETWSPTIHDRIKLIIQLCRGLQHAHQRGILHRDLKPANILVTVQDKKVIPKIIDFGLAKSFHKPLLPGSTDTTQMGCLLGTIGYMSPEQANTAIRDIDTRSDVYSLCAILYELLTGTLPIPREELHRVSLARALEMIQHKEPDAASHRATKNPHVLTHAARCHTNPVKLATELRGDIDAILEKGLTKERERRYQSAGDLADDLERYLTGGVVQARPRTAWYVAEKMMRRHWKAALAVSTISLLFLISWFGLAFGIYYAIGERNRAQQAEASRKASEIKERLHKEDAEASNRFFDSVFNYPHPFHNKGQDAKLLDALDYAVAKLNTSFEAQPRAEAMVRLTLSRCYLRLGKAQQAEQLLDPLLHSPTKRFDELRGEQLKGEMLMVQILLEQNSLSEAETQFERLKSNLKTDEMASATSLRSLYQSMAMAFVNNRDFAKSEKFLQDAIRLYDQNQERHGADLAWALRSSLLSVQIKWARSDSSKRTAALEMAKSLGDQLSYLPGDHPLLLQLQCQLAEALALNQQFDEAHQVLNQAFDNATKKYGADDLYTITIQSNMAQVFLQENHFQQAQTLLTEVLRRQQSILSPGHSVIQQTLDDLAKVCEKQGNYWSSLGYCHVLYEGQLSSLGKLNSKVKKTEIRLMELSERASVQWMWWSLVF